MSNPALSVVAIFHNQERFALDCCRSLRQSTNRTDVEFILVETGSQDLTKDVLRRAEVADSRFRLVTDLHHSGPSTARNTGIRVASGRLICFVDGDDWVRTGFYDDVIEMAGHFGQAAFIKFELTRVEGVRRTTMRCPTNSVNTLTTARSQILPFDKTTMVDMPHNSAGVYNRALMSEEELLFDSALTTAEDRPWTWRHYLGGHQMVASALSGHFYRQHSVDQEVPRQLTRVGDERQTHFGLAFERIFRDVYQPGNEVFVRKAIRQFLAITYNNMTRTHLDPGIRSLMCRRARAALKLVAVDDLVDDLSSLHGKRHRFLSTHLHQRNCECS